MHLVFAIAAFLLITLPKSVHAQRLTLSKCFPAAINDLQEVQFPQERQDATRKYRNTEIFGYNAQEFNTVVTVYIYDKKPIKQLPQEFRISAAEILEAHTGAESPMSGPSKLSIAGKPTEGFLGIFLWSEGQTDYGSFLCVNATRN